MRQEDEWAYALAARIESAFNDRGLYRTGNAYTGDHLTQRFRVESGGRAASVVGEPSIICETKGHDGRWRQSDSAMPARTFVASEAPFGLTRKPVAA